MTNFQPKKMKITCQSMALINGDFILFKYGWEKCKCVNYENVSIIPYSMIILTLIYREKGNKKSKSIILAE